MALEAIAMEGPEAYVSDHVARLIATCSRGGTGSVSCNSAFVLHLCRFLNQEDLMEREAMVQHP